MNKDVMHHTLTVAALGFLSVFLFNEAIEAIDDGKVLKPILATLACAATGAYALNKAPKIFA